MAPVSKNKKNKHSHQSPANTRPLPPSEGKKLRVKEINGAEKLLPGKTREHAGIFTLLFLGTLAFYSPTLGFDFFSVDDPDYTFLNPYIKEVSVENIKYILSHPYFANYSPVHLFSYMIDYAFKGADAYTFHLSSNIWGGLVSGFVYLTALALTKNKLVSIAAGLLFIVHPVHVEAIAWISSRKDLVATAFILPSFLAYLKYRKGKNKLKWYFFSVFLFVLAVGGKLSVATFPAVLFAVDYFMEKRPFARSITDKIPYLASALIIAIIASSAQPSMGNDKDPLIILKALGQNAWLLSGFASYVIYRVPPSSGTYFMQILAALALALVFIAPVLLKRRFPLFAVLIYWILFAFIPTQALSFTHPVTDRYLFLPSVAFVILLPLFLNMMGQKWNDQKKMTLILPTLLLAFFWSVASLNYLKDWNNPHSVWKSSLEKSSDPLIPQNLGSYYLGLADKIIANPSGQPMVNTAQNKLARDLWDKKPQLNTLQASWNKGIKSSPEEIQFTNELRQLSWAAFELALKNKGSHVMPGVYYNRGLILMNQGKQAEAKNEFLTCIQESDKENFLQVQYQLKTYSYYNLGIIEWQAGNLSLALQNLLKAESFQNLSGRIWLPGLKGSITSLEQYISSLNSPQ